MMNVYSPGYSPVLNVDYLELHRWLEWNGPTEGYKYYLGSRKITHWLREHSVLDFWRVILTNRQW